MAVERSINSQIGKFIKGLNAGVPSPSELIVPYSKISDEELRVSLRTGELIVVAADRKGVQLSLAGTDESVDWLNFRSETVMGLLNRHDVKTVRKVLEEAKKQANDNLNGDRDKVLELISGLISTVGKNGTVGLDLPSILARNGNPQDAGLVRPQPIVVESNGWKPRESGLPRGPGSHSGENKQTRGQSSHNGRGRTKGSTVIEISSSKE